MSSVYIGADIGTTSTKAIAVDMHGNILASAQQGYPMLHPADAFAVQDANDYWDALVYCIQEIGRQISLAGLKRLAFSAQGDTLVFYDDQGLVTSEAISWMDTRGSFLLDDLLKRKPQQFWLTETGQPLSAYSSLTKLCWLQDDQPDFLKMNRVGWVSDFINLRLTGRRVIDHSSASWTPLYNPSTLDWSAKVCDIASVKLLPEVIISGQCAGPITEDVANQLGLSQSVEVIAGAFDQAAAAHGCGANGDVYTLSCGTAWVLYVPSAMLNQYGSLCLCSHVSRDSWGYVMPFSGGAVYEWACGVLQASDKPSGSPLPVVIPHLYGGLSPDWNSDSRGAITGLTVATSAADIRLGVQRSLLFEARRNLEALPAGMSPESIRLVGGAAKDEWLVQKAADILGCPVEATESFESACYGAAKLAAGEVATSWQGPSFSCDQPQMNEDEAYQEYLRVYRSLQPDA